MAATVVATLGLQHLIAASNAPDAALQAIVSAHMRSQISGQPVDVVSTDRHTVKPWLAGKLPVAAEVVDLAEAGFPLAGGRIDIVAGAGVPTLVYKRRDHLISVTELRAEGDETAHPAQSRGGRLSGRPLVGQRARLRGGFGSLADRTRRICLGVPAGGGEGARRRGRERVGELMRRREAPPLARRCWSVAGKWRGERGFWREGQEKHVRRNRREVGRKRGS